MIKRKLITKGYFQKYISSIFLIKIRELEQRQKTSPLRSLKKNVTYEPVNKNNHIDLVIAYTIKLSRAKHKKNIHFLQKINLVNMYRNNTKALPMVPNDHQKKPKSLINYNYHFHRMKVTTKVNDMNSFNNRVQSSWEFLKS